MKSSQSHSRFFVLAIRIGIAVLLCGLFTGIVLAAGLTDASVDDFSLGTGCYVSQADTGQVAGAVIIPPTAGTIFSGTTPDTGWLIGGSSYLQAGNVYVDEGTVFTNQNYPPNRMLEFVATFRNIESQHAGFGNTLSSQPWAIFSTGGGGELRARTDISDSAGDEDNTNLGFGYYGDPHVYRIEWLATGTRFWIDGNLVATHNIANNVNMRPAVADQNNYIYNPPGISLTVNWMRMSDYTPSPCTYTSRVIDSGVAGADWTNFTTAVDLPAGTSISFDVRADDSDISSGTWGLVESNAITVTGRYVQYRATLTTTNPLVTPQLLSAVFAGLGPNAVTLTSISAAPTTSPGAGWLFAGLSGAGLLLALYGYRQIRRRSQA